MVLVVTYLTASCDPHVFLLWSFTTSFHCLQPEDIEINSSGDEEEVDQDLLEWGEAGKIFGLLEATDEIDEEEHQKVVDRIKLFREGIAKQIRGLKLQDKGLAIVQEAVAKHPLRALGPLLDAAMVELRGSKTHPVASTGQHVMGKSFAPIPSTNYLPSPTPTPGPSTLTNTSTLAPPDTAIPSAQAIPTSQWTATRINVDGMHKYKCSGCGVVQAMRNAVLSHIRVVHTKTKLGPCPHCGVFTSTSNDSYR